MPLEIMRCVHAEVMAARIARQRLLIDILLLRHRIKIRIRILIKTQIRNQIRNLVLNQNRVRSLLHLLHVRNRNHVLLAQRVLFAQRVLLLLLARNVHRHRILLIRILLDRIHLQDRILQAKILLGRILRGHAAAPIGC